MNRLNIAHLPYTGVMYDIFNKHMIDMSNLESMYGINSYILPSVSYFSKNIPEGYDIIHIHGVPHIDDSLQFLNFIRNLYINNQKFVISVYNYSLLCERFILQDEDRTQCFDCKNEKCLNSRQIYSFLKDVNIFVYSDNIKEFLISNGFSNIYKLPISQEFKSFDFKFNENEYQDIDSCGYFKYPQLFDKENKYINNIINKYDYKYKELNYDNNINTGKSLLSYNWNCTFPYDISYCLSYGNSIILNNEYKFNEYENINKYINYFDFSSDLTNILDKKVIIDEIKLVSYEYWKNFGPHYCISYYDSYYRKILEK